jgi:hypothetical protein
MSFNLLRSTEKETRLDWNNDATDRIAANDGVLGCDDLGGTPMKTGLRVLRIEKEWLQADLATHVGVARGTIGNAANSCPPTTYEALQLVHDLLTWTKQAGYI